MGCTTSEATSAELAPASPMGASALVSLSSRLAWILATLPFNIIGGSVDLVINCLYQGAIATASLLNVLGLGPLPAPLSLDRVPAALPSDVVWEIVSRMAPTLQEIRSTRSVCKQWMAGVPPPFGPWLVLCRPDDADIEQKFNGLQLKHTAGVGQPEIVRLPWFSPPPLHASFWGATHGLLGTSNVSLFCIICGEEVALSELELDDMTPAGYFFNENAFQSFAAISSDHLNWNCELHFEALDLDVAAQPMWMRYPSATGYSMKSVIFKAGVHLIGITQMNLLFIDELGGPPGHAVSVLLVPTPADADEVVWENNGRHVFKCSERVYVCLVSRTCDHAVKAAVFQLEQDDGYSLLPTNSIGNYALYLGANQAFALPAVLGSRIQCSNTIYVLNDDGNHREGELLVIDISTGHVSSTIPFPVGVNINDYRCAAWVAAGRPGGPIVHCNN